MNTKKKSFYKRPLFYIPVGIVVLIVLLIALLLSRKGAPSYVTAAAQVTNLKQIVSVTGNVHPISDVSLAFEKSGRVQTIPVDVGQKVVAGEVLATLQNADLAASLAQANASVKAEQAKLNELFLGSALEDIDIEKVKLANAQTSLTVAKKSAADTIQSVGTVIDDTIRNKVDTFFSNPNSGQPTFDQPADSQLKAALQNGRASMAPILLYAAASTTADSTAVTGVLVSQLDFAKQNLNVVEKFVDLVAQAVNQLDSNSSLSDTTIANDKSLISAARTALDTQISAVTSAESALQSAQSGVDLENSQLAKIETPARLQDIQAQQAQVEQAQANADNASAQLAKTVLRSPIAGVVTEKNIEVGEIVGANSPVISVISDGQFDVEAYVAESDIANVKVGDAADLTLDAYPGIHFPAQITEVDPGETITQNVATYKVTLQFTQSDSRIKSGMTANIDITTAEAPNALVVPSRSVIQKSDGSTVVKVLKNGVIQEENVTVGIKDGEGHTQILSGLNAGDTVVVSGS